MIINMTISHDYKHDYFTWLKTRLFHMIINMTISHDYEHDYEHDYFTWL